MIKGRFTMKHIIFLISPFFLFATSSFITPMEYSSQLYKNPRGIGCQHCHGENGEGKIVANYVDKKQKKSFEGPAINKIDYNKFYIALSKRVDGMPRYFLIDKEIEALYLFVHKNNEKEVKNDK